MQRLDELPLHEPLSQNELLDFARTSQRPLAEMKSAVRTKLVKDRVQGLAASLFRRFADLAL